MSAMDKIQVPSIGLIITGFLGAGFSLLVTFTGVFENYSKTFKNNTEFASGIATIVICASFVLLAFLGITAGFLMRNFRYYGLCMAGCISMIIPCYNSCCGLGMIFGIWGLIVLLNPEVRAAFKHVSAGGDPNQIPPFGTSNVYEAQVVPEPYDPNRPPPAV
jgi:hypothetical protein